MTKWSFSRKVGTAAALLLLGVSMAFSIDVREIFLGRSGDSRALLACE